jgi:hypothetical protein
MPITVRNYVDDSNGDEIAFLCEEVWHLRDQLRELETWLVTRAVELSAGEYVVDIGFSPRDDAAGGGTVLSADALRIMAAKGMSLELSEYPPFE